jgi:hypothetical protein
MVMDVSSDGANLLVESPLSGDAPLWLIVENVGPIAAQVAWQEKSRVGLCFLEEQDWVLQVSKQRFDSTAWLNNNEPENSLDPGNCSKSSARIPSWD